MLHIEAPPSQAQRLLLPAAAAQFPVLREGDFTPLRHSGDPVHSVIHEFDMDLGGPWALHRPAVGITTVPDERRLLIGSRGKRLNG